MELARSLRCFALHTHPGNPNTRVAEFTTEKGGATDDFIRIRTHSGVDIQVGKTYRFVLEAVQE